MIRTAALCALLSACALAGADTGVGKDDGGGSGNSGKVPGDGIAQQTCSPFSTPAFQFLIGLDSDTCDASPTDTMLRISLWTDDLPPRAGETYAFSVAEGVGEAVLIGAENPEGESAAEVELTLTEHANEEWKGSYRLEFAHGDTLEGSFSVVDCPSDIEC